jgi:hypothetical protein
LYIDIDPFNSVINDINRCYFWKVLDNRAECTLNYINQERIQIYTESQDELKKSISNGKLLRKYVTHTFNHGVKEIKKVLNEKEKKYDITKLNTHIGFVNNLIIVASKLIEFGFTDSDFVNE